MPLLRHHQPSEEVNSDRSLMNSFKFFALLGGSAAALVFGSCGQGEVVQPEPEKVEEDVRGSWISDHLYENRFLNLLIEIPEDWALQRDENKNQQLLDTGTELLAGDDLELKETWEESIESAYIVGVASKRPLGTPGLNPNISFTLENVRAAGGFTSAADYFPALKQTLRDSQIQVEFEDTPSPTTIGEIDFFKLDGTVSLEGIEIKQRYWVCKRHHYILLIVATWFDDSEEQELVDIIHAIRPAK